MRDCAVRSFVNYAGRGPKGRNPDQIAHMTRINPPVAQPVA
jgi:hypothetical protein